MSEPTWAAIVLAAGKGVRMRSSLPKVLHPVAGRPMVSHVIAALREAGIRDVIVVVGHEGGRVRSVLGPDIRSVEQADQLGTGHAVLQTKAEAAQYDNLLVLSGDVPLISPPTLRTLMERHIGACAQITLLTAEVEDREGLGRVLRDDEGRVQAIVETADANETVLALREVNAGAYCISAGWLWPQLERLAPSRSGEYYLTALIETAVTEGAVVEAVLAGDGIEALGVNDREQLSRAETALRQRLLRKLMREDGVTIVDPATTYIDAGVSIGQDTTIEPNTHIRGESRIGANCVIGPNAVLKNARIGERCTIGASLVEDSELEADVSLGPYGHLRGNAYVETGAELGDHVEIKNSRIGRDSKVHHFSYIGDATLGASVNIGAGAVTCNFDGAAKHRTVIGDGAFIGSDTMLVAPVTVGKGARTGAGSVVTRNVPDGVTVAGVPARTLLKAERARLTDGS